MHAKMWVTGLEYLDLLEEGRSRWHFGHTTYTGCWLFLLMPLFWYSSSTKPYNTLAMKQSGQTALNISFGVTLLLSCFFFFFINTPVRLLQRSCWLNFSAAVSEKWLLWRRNWNRVCASAGEKTILLSCIFSFPAFDWLNYYYLAFLNWKKLLGLVCVLSKEHSKD